MLNLNQAADPIIHRCACRIANRLLFMVQPLLRGGEEHAILAREAYAVAREELECMNLPKGESNGKAAP